MNKYYTPSIEEFHIGFECETTNNGKNWFKIKFEYYNFIALEEELLNGMYRVKYLDKDDVEDLGFKHDRCNKTGDVFTFKTRESLFNFEKHLFYSELDYGIEPLFIKNKSELNRVMKMLNMK